METTEMRGLAGIARCLDWLEGLLNLLNGPMLVFGAGIALVDLLTDGRLTADVSLLLFAWAISQALGIDTQLLGCFARAREAHGWPRFGWLVLGFILCVAAWQAGYVYAIQQAEHITEAAALAQLGMPAWLWLAERAALAVGLVALSGWTRYRQPKATAIETPETLAQRQAYELAIARHRAELRAVNAAGMRGMIAAGIGRVNPLDTPDDTPDDTPAIDAQTDAPSADDTPPDDGGNGGHNTPGNRRTSRRNHPGLKAVPSGTWKRDDLQRWALAKYGEAITDDEATAVIRTLGKRHRIGRSYVAPIAVVKAWIADPKNRANTTGNAEPIAADRSA